MAEPGRFVCGPAAISLSTVMGRAKREGRWWYYLDDGIYGTFSGQVYDKMRFPVEPLRRNGSPARSLRHFGPDLRQPRRGGRGLADAGARDGGAPRRAPDWRLHHGLCDRLQFFSAGEGHRRQCRARARAEAPCACLARRRALQGILSAAAVLTLPVRAALASGDRLVLINTHTGEVIDTVYRTDSRIIAQANSAASTGCCAITARARYCRSTPGCSISCASLQRRQGSSRATRLFPATARRRRTRCWSQARTAFLRGASTWKERQSTCGSKACRLNGCATSHLAKRAGGVGYYPASDFVHLDVGRVRSWSG